MIAAQGDVQPAAVTRHTRQPAHHLFSLAPPTLPHGEPPARAAATAGGRGSWGHTVPAVGEEGVPGGHPRRHVFVLEWGARGEAPPSQAVAQVVTQLQVRWSGGSLLHSPGYSTTAQPGLLNKQHLT